MRGYILKAEMIHLGRIRFALINREGVPVLVTDYIEWDGICEVRYRHVSREVAGNKRLQIRFNGLIKLRLERYGCLVIQKVE